MRSSYDCFHDFNIHCNAFARKDLTIGWNKTEQNFLWIWTKVTCKQFIFQPKQSMSSTMSTCVCMYIISCYTSTVNVIYTGCCIEMCKCRAKCCHCMPICLRPSWIVPYLSTINLKQHNSTPHRSLVHKSQSHRRLAFAQLSQDFSKLWSLPSFSLC